MSAENREQEEESVAVTAVAASVAPPPQQLRTIVSLSSKPATSSSSSSSSSLVISSRQKGNPLIKHLQNVQWAYSDTLVPDYSMTRNSCAYYLSLKYHLLNPTYIHTALKTLGRAYELRVLLAVCDIKDPKHCVKEIEKICLYFNMTLILCWSNEEAAHYLETYKIYEFKGADMIMEKSGDQQHTAHNSNNRNNNNINNAQTSQFVSAFSDFLGSIKSINKTDTSTLRQTFGSIKQISESSKEELNLCPGLGSLKANRLYDIFRTPFKIEKQPTSKSTADVAST